MTATGHLRSLTPLKCPLVLPLLVQLSPYAACLFSPRVSLPHPSGTSTGDQRPDAAAMALGSSVLTPPPPNTLESVRDSLIRLEDTIVFSLIERAKHPANGPIYASSAADGAASSFLESFARESERVHAQAGRYEDPDEVPFFPSELSSSSPFPSPSPQNSAQQFLHPPAASANVTKEIWEVYVQNLLPLIAADGDDGNYAVAASSDLACLQALSRRIHLGRFVAEAKFREAPEEYSRLIRAKDNDALMKLLTVQSVEEAVKKRVERKAMVFGQDITAATTNSSSEGNTKYKVDPRVAYTLYDQWVIPLTKVVEVEYLLRRLDP